jgi:Flp pilus assembly protein TadG
VSARVRSRRQQRGAVALEFALVLPLFLLVVAGTGTIGQALVLRYQLSDAAMVASRSLALGGTADTGAAGVIVRSRLGKAADRCATLQLAVETASFMGGARALRVALTCNFKVGLAEGLLRTAGLSPLHLAVSAATPF